MMPTKVVTNSGFRVAMTNESAERRSRFTVSTDEENFLALLCNKIIKTYIKSHK